MPFLWKSLDKYSFQTLEAIHIHQDKCLDVSEQQSFLLYLRQDIQLLGNDIGMQCHDFHSFIVLVRKQFLLSNIKTAPGSLVNGIEGLICILTP